MLIFAQGFLVGFLIAAPVGPIGLLCIRRSLQGGWRLGFASGLGAALADAGYAAVAAFGLNAASQFLRQHVREFQIVGAAILVVLAVQTIRNSLRDNTLAVPGARAIAGATASTFLLTLVNPTTVLSFAAAFALIALHVGPLSKFFAALFVLGAFCGSASWWLMLSLGFSAFRTRIKPAILKWITVGSGVGLMGFAMWMFLP